MKTLMMIGVVLLGAGAAPAVTAQAVQPSDLQPIRETDQTMACAAIADEAARLSANMGGQAGSSIFDRLGGVARSGAAILVPGAGLVIAGADALTQPQRQRREAEALAGQNRWYYLNGVYAGRQCHERAEAAMTAAASPGTSAAPATAAAIASPAASAAPGDED